MLEAGQRHTDYAHVWRDHPILRLPEGLQSHGEQVNVWTDIPVPNRLLSQRGDIDHDQKGLPEYGQVER